MTHLTECPNCGLDLVEAAAFTPADLQALRSMLEDPAQRFLHPGTLCWQWVGTNTFAKHPRNTIPSLAWKGHRWSILRLSAIAYLGVPASETHMIRSPCSPLCYNPQHLEIGGQKLRGKDWWAIRLDAEAGAHAGDLVRRYGITLRHAYKFTRDAAKRKADTKGRAAKTRPIVSDPELSNSRP